VSSKPWIAILKGGRIVRWSEGPPYVDGDQAIAETVLSRLSTDEDGLIGVTPNGPFVAADPADPLAVAAALREIDPKVRISKSGPVVEAAPSGAVS
jgi:hypothetical protein